MDMIVCKIADTPAERQAHFEVRRAVFVEEQRLFDLTDIDEHDRDAIPIVAVDPLSGAVVGAVRCYPAGDGVWYGGRLAVLQPYRQRAASIGASLCRVAEATVLAHGCREFLAYIQRQNVRFFQRLGWRPVGEPVLHCGQPHQLMAASLAAARPAAEATAARQVAHV